MGMRKQTVFANFLEYPQGDTLIVVEAGELATTSSLRKLFETSSIAQLSPVMRKAARISIGLVIDHLRQHGLTITSDAKAYLLQCLGEDRTGDAAGAGQAGAV